MARRPERGVTRPGEPARMPAAGRICGHERSPASCTREVFARGLCRRHYRRAAKGLPLDPDQGREVGVTASGHGLCGVVTTNDDGRLLCHECGRHYLALGVHIGMRHGSTRDYRLTHGLLMSTPLTAPELTARRRTATRDNDRGRRLEDKRRTDIADRADPELTGRGHRLRHARARLE